MGKAATIKDKGYLSGYDLTTLLIRGGLAKLNVTANTKLVLLYFASCYNAKKGVVFPKIKTVADSVGISEIGVKRAVAELIEKGCILKTKKGANANQYLITNKITGYQNDTSQIDTLPDQNDTSESIKMIPSCHELKQEELKQTTTDVVFLKEFKGVDKEETGCTAVSSFETEIPDILKEKAKKGEIRNLKAYWNSLRPAVKQEYIEVDAAEKKRIAALKQQENEKQQYWRKLEEIGKEPPFYTLFDEKAARDYITKVQRKLDRNLTGIISRYLIEKFNFEY